MKPLPRYPVYVISKGRAACCLTAKFLLADRVPFSLVVEPQEEDLYRAAHPDAAITTLPFSNLGRGSIPARNWCWEDAASSGFERHWILDDNIRGCWRRWKTYRIRCDSSVAFRVCEDFTDRYLNIAIAGLNYYMFAPDRQKTAPFYHNVHVYSCMLIRNDLPYRWRGRYNEDADLCLQVLSGGWCTILINAFLAEKITTMTMPGGNSAELYQGDGRLKMARSLERVWPGVVETKRRFQRPQHVIRDGWRKFDTPLQLKPEVDLAALAAHGPDEYGLKLEQRKPIQSSIYRALAESELGPYQEAAPPTQEPPP